MFPRLNGHFLLDEVHFIERHNDQVGESKSTRLLGFSLVSGKDVRAS